jgi:protein-S-isoprenylcysteine O-methyltransferase Ste14
MRIPIPAIVILVVALLFFFLVPSVQQLRWTPLRIGGAILAGIAYILVITARIQLGRSFAFRPEARQLVTRGFYSRIRNPMYVFLDFMVLGLIIVMQAYWFLIVLAVLVIFQTRQARRESKVLLEKFGESYLEYRKQTWF